MHALLAALLALLALAAPTAAAPVPPERALYDDGPDGRYLLEAGWATRPDRRGARWRRVSVPHSFNAADRSRRGFASRVQWYRLRFDLPRDRSAAGWRLRFESVNRRAEVWLNGRRLGDHEGAHLPFELAARGVRARDNVLLVRVDGRMADSDLPPASRPRGWWNWGGILREVYLRRVGALDLADLQVTTERGTPARIRWRAMVRNASRSAQRTRIAATVTGPDGAIVARAPATERDVAPGRLAQVSGEATLASARDWSPRDPALYRLELRMPGGQVVTTRFGFREWGVDGEGRATLNGAPLSLRGASFHEETLARGGALGPAQHGQIVDELRSLGADFARAHYPPHPALLEAFDRAGIVFWEQIPVWRLRDRNYRSRALRREALARLRTAILRDRNHAAVMTWSVANESLRAGGSEARYIRAARAVAKTLDPTRLVAADIALRPLDDIPDHYRTLDAIGLNEYVGWYGGSTTELPGDLDSVRRRFPGVALFVTEFGAEANRQGPASEKGTYEFQRAYLAEQLRLIGSSAAVSGALVWVLRDFLVRPGWHGGNPRPDPPFNRKGIFDHTGAPKPAFDVVRDAFLATPPTRPASALLRSGQAAALPASAGRIVYSAGAPRAEHGAGDLFVVNADGSRVRRLTATRAREADPAFSPDGTRIAFGREARGRSDLWAIDAGGGGLERLTRGRRFAAEPAWSADGRRVAFTDERARGGQAVFVLDTRGGRIRQVTRPRRGQRDFAPAWSPDGRTIAFTRTLGRAGSAVYRVDPDGSALRRLTSARTLRHAQQPDFSPDGATIALAGSRGRDEPLSVWTIAAHGSDPTRVAAPLRGASAVAPAFSPDGTHLAFARYRPGGRNPDIHAVPLAGGGEEEIVATGDSELFPDWGPS